ncbi:MAG: hypothetical protein M1325_04410 [Actinobacteria bacterium]|nr:hypothetical protein [Actinomycetota bacterium]
MPGYGVPRHFDLGVRLDTSLVATPQAMEQALAAFREEFALAGDDIGQHVQSRVQAIIEDQEMVNEGTLLGSITWAKAMIGSVLEVLVGTNVPYAKYKEFGTVPHFVPFHIAKSLYNQAKHEWGWVDPPGRAAYEQDSKGRVWLAPAPGAKPTWGVFVTGMRKPFLFPGWQASLDYIETRLKEAGRRAIERIQGGS